MKLSASVLGTTVVRTLETRAAFPLLQIGSDSFTRKDLAKVECYNFTAAHNLSALLNLHLKVPNTKHVFYHVPPSALALPRLGAISLAVLGAAFEAKGLGGDNPLEAYLLQHAPEGVTPTQAVMTFATLKAREAKEHADERKSLKQRKASRRHQAHKLRVARYSARVEAAST